MSVETLTIISLVSAALFELIKRKVAADGLTEDDKAKLRVGVVLTGAVTALSAWGFGLLGSDEAGHLGLAIIGAMSARDAMKGVRGVAAQKGIGSLPSSGRPPEPPLP